MKECKLHKKLNPIPCVHQWGDVLKSARAKQEVLLDKLYYIDEH